MKVYRVEDASLIGPYRAKENRIYSLCDWHQPCAANRPAPWDEGLEIVGLHCGFKSKNQLFRWFPRRDLITLIAAGYQVKVFDVPKCDMHVGKYQITFKRSAYAPVDILHIN